MSIPISMAVKGLHRPAAPAFLPVVVLAGIAICGCGSQIVTGSKGPPPVQGTTFYADCSAASNGSGTQSSPWNALASVNGSSFSAGDQILFKRGTTCSGSLTPMGSGTSSSPIVIDAYGTGPQPIIDGGTNLAAVQLVDEQGWEINNLEVVGGNNYGVNIAGKSPNTTYSHFRLRNLNVHGAHFISTMAHDSGEIVITIGNAGESFNDVVIDGVTVHDSTVSDGIYVDAGVFGTSSAAILGNDNTIQNSSVYNVYGEGMTLFVVSNGLMQNNVVHNAGQCPPNPGCGAGTPGGLMDLYCSSCVIRNNEAYDIQDWSPWDGGDFDIDVWNDHNIVEYNYGHDSIGYCVSVFSASNVVGTDHVVRYNVCANNGRLANSPDPGEIFMNTSNGTSSGALDGVAVYNNTLYWNPATPGPAFNTANAVFVGTHPNFFKNNIIYSTVAGLVETTSNFALDNNVYWTVGAAPDWNFNGTDYAGLSSYQAASGQDAHSLYADPMLNTPAYHSVGRPVTALTLLPGSPALSAGTNVCGEQSGCSMGGQDFWGNALPSGSGYNIGAWQ